MNTQKTISGETLSCWTDIETFQPIPSPHTQSLVDVCVVGAGIAGLSSAYHLAQLGQSVVIVDMGPIFGGQSGRTTAHLSCIPDERVQNLVKIHGTEKVTLMIDSQIQAIDRIEEICSEESILCDFKRLDAFLYSRAESLPDLRTDILGEEFETLRKLGFKDVESVEWVEALPFYSGPALKYGNQAQFHPVKYMNGLAQAIDRMGGRFYLHQKVSEIKDGEPATVTLENGQMIKARRVIVATNSPINDRFAIHTKQMAYRTYAVAAPIPKGSIKPGLYWDTEDPFHYVRLMESEDQSPDTLIIGGEDHRTGQDHQPQDRLIALEAWARGHFSEIRTFSHRWSGQVCLPADHLPFIGKNPHSQNVFIVTGDSGQGMTFGTVAGILLRDLIMGIKNPWEKLYDPSRKPYFASLDYLRENLNTAWQYSDYLRPGDVKDSDEIAPGEGAIIQKGLHKVAVYKDERGEISRFSAVCPHLGGIVHWNTAEKSWDCPCHGSRFAANGNVITGPANCGLEAVIDDTPAQTPAVAKNGILERTPYPFADLPRAMRS